MIIQPDAHRGRRHHRPRAAHGRPRVLRPRVLPEEFATHGLEPTVAQCNISFNHQRGTLRGMHYQLAAAPEAKLVRCIARRDLRRDRRPAAGLADVPAARRRRADRRQPPRALRAADVRARLPDADDDTEVHLPGQRVLHARQRARPALRRPGAGHRLAAAGDRRSPTRTRPGRCSSAQERRPRDHRRHAPGRGARRGPADPGGDGRRRVHGPRHRQPDRQLRPGHGAGRDRQPHAGQRPSAPTARPASTSAEVVDDAQGSTRPSRAASRRSPTTTRAVCEADGIDADRRRRPARSSSARTSSLAAIEHGKHVVLMNAELDGTVGPLLARRADAAGVVFTGVRRRPAGRADEPVPVRPRHRPHAAGLRQHQGPAGPVPQPRRPSRASREKWGQDPYMVTSFADGTKISFEQAIVANATGMTVGAARHARRGPRRPCRRADRRATTSTSCASSAASSTTSSAPSRARASSCSPRTTTRSSGTT